MSPLGFLVECCVGEFSKGANDTSVNAAGGGRKFSSGRFIHKRHKLVGKSRHGAADTNSTNIGSSAESRHPSAFWYIAIDDGSPASQFHDAFRRAILRCKVALFVISGAVTTFMNSFSK